MPTPSLSLGSIGVSSSWSSSGSTLERSYSSSSLRASPKASPGRVPQKSFGRQPARVAAAPVSPNASPSFAATADESSSSTVSLNDAEFAQSFRQELARDLPTIQDEVDHEKEATDLRAELDALRKELQDLRDASSKNDEAWQRENIRLKEQLTAANSREAAQQEQLCVGADQLALCRQELLDLQEHQLKSLTVVEDATKRHDELFAEFPEPEVKKVSRMEREKKELANRSLVYGEIPFETVDAIFQLMRTQFGVLLDNGGNFYDIGSGCGKVVMAAALLHDFSKCCGIEVLDGLHDVALKALDRWRYQMLDSLPATKANVDVGFAKGDAIKRPDIWRDGTLVFCNSTCFSDSLIQAISAEADQLRVGSYFVTVTKPLQSTRWQAVHEEKFHMSWGRATVIIQKKMF
ncbi:hypothetical protein KRP22_014126 [Phytophthora ramorum]|nr:hypothetical protein KRP22_9275 [Phytophthora ramorum]